MVYSSIMVEKATMYSYQSIYLFLYAHVCFEEFIRNESPFLMLDFFVQRSRYMQENTRDGYGSIFIDSGYVIVEE